MKSIENSYRIDYTRIYGQGAYGTVYKCIDLKDQEKKLCVKIVNYNQYEQEKFLRELNVMIQIIDHGITNQNIVKVEMATEEKGLLYFVMEKCDQELKQYLENRNKLNNPMKLSEALDCIRQIMNGYKVLFEYGLMHRDIKPDNILMTFKDGQPVYKLADFGMAKLHKSYDKSEQTVKGTPVWASPQVFQVQSYSAKTDIYSLGLLFYFIIFGSLPYGPYGSIRNRKQLFDIQKGFKSNPFRVDFSIIKERIDVEHKKTEQLAQLIESMIRYEEDDRIQFENVFSHTLINLNAQRRVDVDEDLFKTMLPPKLIQQKDSITVQNQIKPMLGQNNSIKQLQTLQPQPNSILGNQQIQQPFKPILTPTQTQQPQHIQNIQFQQNNKPNSQIPLVQQQNIQQQIIHQNIQLGNQNQHSPQFVQKNNGLIQQNGQIKPNQQITNRKIQIVIKKNFETILFENFLRYISINTQAENVVLDLIYICCTYFIKRQPMSQGHFEVYIKQLKNNYQDQRDQNLNHLSLSELTKTVQQLYKQNIQLFPYKQNRMYYQEYTRMICFLEFISNSLPIDKLIQDALDYSCDPGKDIIEIIYYIQVQRTL